MPAGLPRRPWYRHLLYAPGYYTGYGVKTMPGVREAIEEKNYAEAEAEIVRVARRSSARRRWSTARRLISRSFGRARLRQGPSFWDGPRLLLRLLCGLSSPQFVRVRPLLFGAI